MKKILWWAAIAFVIYFIATAPNNAGFTAEGILHWLRHAANNTSVFLSHLH